VVKWSVNDIEGGNKQYGTISPDGIYHAPDKMPHPREIHIGGYAEEAQNKLLYATVIVGSAPLQYKTVKIWSKPLEGAELNIKSPHGVGLDKEGNILMADEKADRIYRFNAEGKFLNDIGEGPGQTPGQFKEPREVRSDPEGNIYVSDSKGDDARIQVFDHQGKLIRTFAEKGRFPGQLLRAHGFGFGPNQTVSIVDVDNMRVNTYERPSGKFLSDFGSWNAYKGMNPGEMNACHGIFVDQNGDVFVNSYYGPTHKFTPEGAILAEFCQGNPPEGSVYFHNLTGDRWGNIYVMARPEGGNEAAIVEGGTENPISVIKFNNNGDFVTEWSYSDPQHRETTAAIDNKDVFYGMYITKTEMVIEIFTEE
jgi:sugar lactone lactonase YvrE